MRKLLIAAILAGMPTMASAQEMEPTCQDAALALNGNSNGLLVPLERYVRDVYRQLNMARMARGCRPIENAPFGAKADDPWALRGVYSLCVRSRGGQSALYDYIIEAFQLGVAMASVAMPQEPRCWN